MLKTAVLSLFLAPLAASAADAPCHSIDDQLQRLACYDKAAEAVVTCANQKDKLDRLLCFDGLAKPLPGGNVPEVSKTPVAPVPTAAPEATVAPASGEERFGLNNKRPQEPDEIRAAIGKMKKDPYGKFVITLDNGQVWKQIDSRRFRLDEEQEVIIRKASLGSFMMSQEGSSKSARVKRVK